MKEYYPLYAGNIWIYDDGSQEVIRGNNRVALVESTGECDGLGDFVTLNNHKGLSLFASFTDSGRVIIIPPATLVSQHPEGGETHATDIPEFGATLVSTVVGYETITVPAGTFENCLKISVSIEFDDPDENHKTFLWFAQNVGMVRVHQYETGPKTDEGCFVAYDRSLISFSVDE